MGGFDQSPETIVQKVACLSIGPVTSCRHGSRGVSAMRPLFPQQQTSLGSVGTSV
jgi:hypothetical protein